MDVEVGVVASNAVRKFQQRSVFRIEYPVKLEEEGKRGVKRKRED